MILLGVTDWNVQGKAQGRSDIPLNELGKKQALHLANRLISDEKWDVLISSDLSRAIETAQIIGSKINLLINHYDKRIREIDCGEIEGTTEKVRQEKWGSSWREMDLGMESFEDVGIRGMEFLEETVCIVSHSISLKLLLDYFENKTLEDLWTSPPIPAASLTLMTINYI